MNEVVEMVVHKFPLLVMLTKLLAVVFQKIRFEFVPVKKIIPVIYDRFKASASDGFCLFRHSGIEVTFALILGIGININVQSFVADGFHCFLVTIARIIIQIERKHPMFQRTCSQCYCFTF